jgi:hypothetical protein
LPKRNGVHITTGNVDTEVALAFDDRMATLRQRRQRTAAAWVVGLLILSSLVLGMLGYQGGDGGVLSWVAPVLVVMGAGFGEAYLVRGQVKGSPLVFAPARWLLITLSVLTLLIAIDFAVALLHGPSQFLSASFYPACIGAWLAGMFRPEEAVKKEPTDAMNEEGTGQTA